MPRAFLITHRRYNSEKDGDQRESSPEHKVSLPEAPTSPNAVQPVYSHFVDDSTSISSNDCPDDLYNLTKLAEVSLAAASGQLYHHRHLSTIPLSPDNNQNVSERSGVTNTSGYAHKLFDRDRDRSNIVRSEKQIGIKPQLHKISSEIIETSQHECPDCGKRYSTSSNLARHRQTHRSLADKKARRCPHCDKVYVSMPAYSMHVRTHVQGCRCPFCGKCFSRPWLLQGHIRTHTGEKPFRCSVCQKAFADKSNLRAHVQTHSDTKPHVCGRCGKAFALKSYLYKHEESSCMRGQRSNNSEQLTSQKIIQQSFQPQIHIPHQSLPPKIHQIQNIIYQPPNDKPIAAPTPVIVRPDRQFRSTVISPNPERAVLSFVERPSGIITTSATGRCCVPLQLPAVQRDNLNQEQPMDFSTNKDGGYGVGLPIAV